MKQPVFAFAVSFFLTSFLPVHSDAETRVWTRKDGKTVEAELINVSGSLLRLKLATGVEFEIEAGELSLNDQHYVVVSQKLNGEAEPVVPRFTFWAYTDDRDHSGTDSLGLYLEFNGTEDLRQVLPTRNFARSGVEEFADLTMGIPPEQLERVRIVVLQGNDAWRPAKFVFQFSEGDRMSEKIEFPVQRWLSMDETEGDTEKTFVFREKIEMSEDHSIMETISKDDVTILRPSRIENVLPSQSTDEFNEHYVAESDQSRGTIEMKFTHENLESTLVGIRSLVLVMQVPQARNAETKSTIAIWSKNNVIGTKKGARKGEEIRIELEPDEFDRSDSIEIVVKCGDDAVLISKKESAPFLEVVFE
ncbi:MAG: SHD1 domain-containing protein [Verrucomicrobiota bacterium]